ncbi:MAG: hypothetical protein NWF03_06865, partial [Candidatus Bathyarchaeota archaeon]|nr:hypothetical protein [Candidatus Bathyarchaeota archaeon]
VVDFTVTSNQDTTPPVLDAVWVLPSTVVGGDVVRVFVDVTDDLSGVSSLIVSLKSESESQGMVAYPSLNVSSGLWEVDVVLSSFAEAGTWFVDYVLVKDSANNQKFYYHDIDYQATFTVDSVPVLLGNVWCSDNLGNVKTTFNLGNSVCVTLPATSQTVSLYLVTDKPTWNDGDVLTDVSSDGVEIVTLNSETGTQSITVWDQPTTSGNYDIIIDVNQNGIFDAAIDIVDSIQIIDVSTVPEFGFDATTSLIAMFVAVGLFAVFMRAKPKSKINKN